MACKQPVEPVIGRKEVAMMVEQPKLRSHQKALKEHLVSLIAHSHGEPITENEVFVNVTCGGGKSTLPIIALKELKKANLVDRVCVVCPKDNLVRQCSSGFENPFFKNLLKHDYSVNEATNDIDPCRGTDGYVTTYQAIGADRAKINYDEFQRHRYLLCLDEIHHVAMDSSWHWSLMPLVAKACFVIYMTGTLEREDGKRIAFIPYEPVQEGNDDEI